MIKQGKKSRLSFTDPSINISEVDWINKFLY